VLKFLLKVVVIIVALGLELDSMLIIAKGHLIGPNFTSILTLHLSASFLSAVVLPKLLSSKYLISWVETFLFFFAIAFFMPVLGIFGLVFAVIPGLRPLHNIQDLPIYINKIRSFSDTSVSQGLQYTHNTVHLENLLCSRDPDKRMNAVYATLKLEDKSAIPLLRMALRDPVDDIRLLAYALIDRKEQRISERVENTKRSLENRKEPNARHLYKSIVKDYWEIVHLGLAEGETLNFVLDKAHEYLEAGLLRYPKDRGLHLQYAKLLLRLGKPQKAYDEFKLAESLGVERQKLLLYYAEIAFLDRRFVEVRQYMREIEGVKAQPKIDSAMRYWQKELSVDG
jgi:polysaccharide biosynthesis protein PelE